MVINNASTSRQQTGLQINILPVIVIIITKTNTIRCFVHLAEQGKARGCSTKVVVIKWVNKSSKHITIGISWLFWLSLCWDKEYFFPSFYSKIFTSVEIFFTMALAFTKTIKCWLRIKYMDILKLPKEISSCQNPWEAGSINYLSRFFPQFAGATFVTISQYFRLTKVNSNNFPRCNLGSPCRGELVNTQFTKT